MVSIPHAPGVYQLRCIPTNLVYVGSSSNMYKRRLYHLRDLRTGTHKVARLQSDYNVYGLDAFEFTVLELTDIDIVFDREQYWLDQIRPFDPVIGYNVGHDARFGFRGLSHTEEARKRISETNKQIGHVITSEQRAKMVAGIRRPETLAKMSVAALGREISQAARDKISQSLTGRPCWRTPEGNVRLSESVRARMSQTYIVTTPAGEELPVTNLKAFCEEHGLSRGTMYSIAAGKRKQCRKWKCRHAD